MSDQEKQNQDSSLTAASRKPFMLGYTVRPIADGRKSIWTKIGAAWEHRDGKGFEVRMEAMPLDGRLVLRTLPEDHEEAGESVGPSPRP
ncbi:MAG: hypothetical protein AAF092_10125 [Pseudomonadota bacterium]